MINYQFIVRRLLLAILVMFGVITFVLTRGISGINPIVLYTTPETPVSQYEQIAERHGFNKPLTTQYFYYLRDLLQGDMGYSVTYGAPTITVIKSLMPATIELAMMSFFITLIIGVPLGVLAALRNGSIIDKLTKGFSLVAVSLPSFWFALILQLVFFFWLQQKGWFHLPSTGREPVAFAGSTLGSITGFYILDSILTLNFEGLIVSIKHLILPSITLAMFPLGLIVRTVRSSTIDVLEEDYIDYARSKGIPGKVLVIKHILKSSLIPVVTVMGLVIGRLLGGSVIVEAVFAWPGLGSWAAASILNNDLAAIMGFTLIVSVFFIIINLIVDLCYGFLDPRIRN